MHTVMVDVDSILWDFCREMHKRMYSLFPNKIPAKYEDWDLPHWDTPKEYFTPPNDITEFFHEIHKDQCEFHPFADAKMLLSSLKKFGYTIMIASHRKPTAQYQLEAWLKLHDLPYDSIFCGSDKTLLFQDPTMNFELLIDDCPVIQNAAIAKGITVYSLEYEYNSGNPDVYYFNHLFPMANSLLDGKVRSEKIPLFLEAS